MFHEPVAQVCDNMKTFRACDTWENISRIVDRQPYVERVTGGKAAKARKIRRDLKYKPAAE